MKREKYVQIGRYLKEKRIEAGYTQQEVSSWFNYSTKQFLSNIENGRAGPPKEMLKTLVFRYKINEEEFIRFFLREEEKELRSILRMT